LNGFDTFKSIKSKYPHTKKHWNRFGIEYKNNKEDISVRNVKSIIYIDEKDRMKKSWLSIVPRVIQKNITASYPNYKTDKKQHEEAIAEIMLYKFPHYVPVKMLYDEEGYMASAIELFFNVKEVSHKIILTITSPQLINNDSAHSVIKTPKLKWKKIGMGFLIGVIVGYIYYNFIISKR
jgi:hypothetical protein